MVGKAETERVNWIGGKSDLGESILVNSILHHGAVTVGHIPNLKSSSSAFPIFPVSPCGPKSKFEQ